MNYYTGKVAIVTGGASGLGLALCRELAVMGAKVVCVDIDQEGAQQTVLDINLAGGEAIAAHWDVTLFEEAQRIIRDIAGKYDRIDFVFNNAGTAIQGEIRDLDVEHWRRVLDVNLWGVIYGTISAYKYMVGQGFGQIVNIGSLAGLIPIPKEIPYCTSKWAIVGFTNSLRVEGADLGVKVNLVCPGVMQTKIHDTVELVCVERGKIIQPKGIRYIDPGDAAKIILKGVERNKPIIVFPFYAWLIWLIYRLSPFIFRFVSRKMIRDFRKIRIKQEGDKDLNP
ncbi:MAG: SDR family oxidoreductase [Proteobacteria bacterium]|nr:SDR family oxidoreductase [Pseudomonadota bacterium]